MYNLVSSTNCVGEFQKHKGVPYKRPMLVSILPFFGTGSGQRRPSSNSFDTDDLSIYNHLYAGNHSEVLHDSESKYILSFHKHYAKPSFLISPTYLRY